MSSTSYSFRLFRKRPSFVEGIAALFDMSPSISKYNTSKTGKEADLKALQADWNAVGKDMNEALEKYAVASSSKSAQ